MANVNPVSPVLVAAPSMLFKTFLLVIVVSGFKLLWKIYFPKLKGLFGEKLVGRTLAGFPEGHRVIDDLRVRTERGMRQVDHVVG
jgi:hypothetical protein